MKPKATLDTNVPMEFWKRQRDAADTESLVSLAARGQVDLAITSRIRVDIPDLPLANRINELSELNVQQIGSVLRFDISVFDGGDMFGSDVFIETVTELEAKFRRHGRMKFPDWRDQDHLNGHFLLGRDVFLTWDGFILAVTSDLQEKLGIVVQKPQDFLDSQTDFMRNSQAACSFT